MCDLPILLVLLCRFKGGKVCSLFHEEEDEAGADDEAGAAPSLSWERAFSSLLGVGRDMFFSLCLKGSCFCSQKEILKDGKSVYV